MERKHRIVDYIKLGTPVLCYLGVSFLVQMVSSMMSISFSEYGTEITTAAAMATFPILALQYRKERAEHPVLSKRTYAILVPLGICLVLGLNNLIAMSGLAAVSESYQETATLLYTPPLAVQLLSVGILVPIVEELIFRGLIYRRLRKMVAALPAIILTALAFGLFHGNIVQGCYGFFAGLALAFVCEQFGTVKASMLLHMIMNITSCLVTEWDGFAWMFGNGNRVLLVTGGTLVGAVLCCRLLQSRREKIC